MASSAPWQVNDRAPEEALAQQSKVHPVLVHLLHQRGVTTPEEVEAFLNPNYDQDVHDPFLFTRMREAVDRIFAALEGDDVLMIHGDYDADGICGTSVIYTAIKEICARAGYDAIELGRVRTFLPDREGDGYGMSMATVEQFGRESVDLIVTVDCGIANTEEIARAYALGMEVIVVDHHQMPQVLSDKAMLIHPLVPGETYPFKKLAAVGVAFKVATALYAAAREKGIEIPEGYEKWLLDYVSIATVADMVPLIGENRTLELYGLQVLEKTRRPGLLALMEVAGLKPGARTTTDIGFRIAPRINAAGRIAHAAAALELLLCEDTATAKKLAERLNEINRERQRLTERATRTAMAQINDASPEPFVAIVDEEIRIGIAGLVAGKVARKTGRPTVVMTRVGEHMVGSGRAPEGFHFVEAMDTCRELMVVGGGHPQACGFKLEPTAVEPWVGAMTTAAEGQQVGEEGAPRTVDYALALSAISMELVEQLAILEPTGMGNEAPVFGSADVAVIAAEAVGNGKHLRLTVAEDEKVIMQCIGFGFGEWAEELKLGDRVHIMYALGKNTWNGRTTIQLELSDIIPV